jgi:ABC-type glycerol-3-phosphate transport system substrate-binding protein
VLINNKNQADANISHVYSINKNSENKVLAWEFLKYRASEEVQGSVNNFRLPINNNAREDFLKTMLFNDILNISNET